MSLPARRRTTWLFDLDDTLHDASRASWAAINASMNDFVVDHLGLPPDEASALRQLYWHRYGATLIGLVRHHGVRAAHFHGETHRLPGLEQRLRTSAHDRAALRRLPGRKIVLTNAPRAYAVRVLDALGLLRLVDAIVAIDDMVMFGTHRPKPDTRMLRALLARLKVRAADAVLVEDTLTHQKAAKRVGIHAVWMQRYLGGRFRGTLGNAPNAGPRREVGVHPCGRPAYVYARIKALTSLRALR